MGWEQRKMHWELKRKQLKGTKTWPLLPQLGWPARAGGQSPLAPALAVWGLAVGASLGALRALT